MPISRNAAENILIRSLGLTGESAIAGPLSGLLDDVIAADNTADGIVRVLNSTPYDDVTGALALAFTGANGDSPSLAELTALTSPVLTQLNQQFSSVSEAGYRAEARQLVGDTAVQVVNDAIAAGRVSGVDSTANIDTLTTTQLIDIYY